MININQSALLFRLINDIRLSVNLWYREGTKTYIKRVYWYLKGYRLAEDIPSGLPRYKPKHFRKKYKITFPQSDPPLVSIIIPVYNQWGYTYDCLHSIWENTQGIDFEVLIADDASTDETRNMNRYVFNVHIIRNETNLGFLKNVNRASMFAKGKYLFLLNNDTQVTEHWLEPIIELMENDPFIGLVGSKLIFANGKLQEAGGIIFRDGLGWNYGRLQDPNLPEFNYLKEVDYCSGAGICIRHSLWDRLGGLDERFAPAYYEDTDLAFAARNLGYKVVYQPRSVIFHFEGISHGRDIRSGIKKQQIENRQVFVEKWQKVLLEEQAAGPGEIFVARDRSQWKKTLVMVDHFIPRSDQDAGSRSTFQYLMLFRQMGLNVKFIPDNFSPDLQYQEQLEQGGIEVLCGATYRDSIFDWFRQNDRFIDIIYLNRPNVSIKYIDFIRENLRVKVIYQPHDLHFLRTKRELEIKKDDSIKELIKYWKDLERKIISSVDINLTFSDLEKTIIKDTFGVNNCFHVPLFLYDDFPDLQNNIELRKDLLFVGGFNHPPNLDAIMWFIHDILPLVKESIPEIKLHIVGSNTPEQLLGMMEQHVKVYGYLTDEELKQLYENVKIVILPLRFGAGVKGKLVEAMYYGTPIVATNIALEGIPCIDQVLLSHDTASDFAQQIIKIYEEPEILNQMQQKSYRFVKNHFSIENGKLIFQEIFNTMQPTI